MTTSSYIPLVDIKNLQSIPVLHIQYIYILIQYTYISIQYIYFLCNQNVRDSHGGGRGYGGRSDHAIYTSICFCLFIYVFIYLFICRVSHIDRQQSLHNPHPVTYIYIYIICSIVTCMKSSLVIVYNGTTFQI